MPALKSPSLKQLGLTPYNFPNRVEDHAFTQQAQYQDDIHDPATLAEIWRVTRMAYRTDKLQEVPFNLTVRAAAIGSKRSSSIFVKEDLPIISAVIKRYVAQQIKYSIWGYLQKDPRLTKYLIRNSPGAISAPIEVEVKAEDRLYITVKGPYWLQFYFTGAKAHWITGHNPAARNMLVFYGSSGDKIVTPRVWIPEIRPGLYIEKAVADVLSKLQSITNGEADNAFREQQANTELSDFLGQAEAFLKYEEKLLRESGRLTHNREVFLKVQQEMRNSSSEMSRIIGDLRRRRQMTFTEETEDRSGEEPYLWEWVRNKQTNELEVFNRGPNPKYKGPRRGYKRSQLQDQYVKALELYLTNYVKYLEFTGAKESRIRDILPPEYMGRRDYRLPPRQSVTKIVNKLREKGIKIKRRRK